MRVSEVSSILGIRQNTLRRTLERHSRRRPDGSVTPALPELLTAEEVAAWLSTTVKAVYAKAERGTLPGATRVGRRLYFLRTELLGLVEQGRVPHLRGSGGGT